jgi:hypothetical protein
MGYVGCQINAAFLLTQRSKILLEKLIVANGANKFLIDYGIQMFVAVYKSVLLDARRVTLVDTYVQYTIFSP